MVLKVEVNLHQETMQIEVQSPTQAVGYVLVLMVLPVGKNWLIKVRKANLQCHHLHQWLLQQKLVEFSVSSVDVVVML